MANLMRGQTDQYLKEGGPIEKGGSAPQKKWGSGPHGPPPRSALECLYKLQFLAG